MSLLDLPLLPGWLSSVSTPVVLFAVGMLIPAVVICLNVLQQLVSYPHSYTLVLWSMADCDRACLKMHHSHPWCFTTFPGSAVRQVTVRTPTSSYSNVGKR